MNRRRFISILATSACGLGLKQIAGAEQAPQLQPVTWRGFTLGAEGSFTLYTENAPRAHKILQVCFREIRRLEAVFSLYNSQSEICRLNRDGQLLTPSPDWLPLCAAISNAHQLTGGGFDPTVQPLWQIYAAHFKAQPNVSTGPTAEKIAATRAQTGWQYVDYQNNQIKFSHPGLQLTLNGIAQGYITDRISQILQDAGYQNVLVELGETRAIGPHPAERPWNIALQTPADDNATQPVIPLENQAIATSAGYGSPLSKDGRFHHLIDPRSGQPAANWSRLSVVAPTATQADALSTGLSCANATTLERVKRDQPGLQIYSLAHS